MPPPLKKILVCSGENFYLGVEFFITEVFFLRSLRRSQLMYFLLISKASKLGSYILLTYFATLIFWRTAFSTDAVTYEHVQGE